MKKVILRLIVAGAALALIVVVLLNTVFKTESSLETHNTIANALSPKGEITQLSEMLNDDYVLELFPTTVALMHSETTTLTNLYPSILVTKQNSDKKTTKMLDKLKALQKALDNANDGYDNLIKSNPEPNVKKKMVKDLQGDLDSALVSLIDLNKIIMDYLIEYYYDDNWDATIALNYIKVAYAKNYINAKVDETKQTSLNNYNKVANLCNASAICNLNTSADFNNLLYNAKYVNIYKLIANANYYESLSAERQILADQITSCIATIILN